ncbi:PREDICTED: cathelicidin antimicrobial peptide [Calidris pugnax]|uniref:cathelicidin antimicrobial peptide n=1 Tax=Calidris pugnax TaxID=198806 RepID=UPI00071C8AF5|nr:PREDICTED: cathelicidin antimicrobial peptide [Calidris pugnax]
MTPRQAVSPLLLLLLLLGLAKATTHGPDGSTLELPGSVSPSPPELQAISYRDVIAAAVELLNARSISPYILQLREVHPRPGWPGDLQGRQELSFTVEETTCRAPGMATTACKRRWFGTVTWCRGNVFLEDQQPTVELSCEKVPTVLGHARRTKIRDFFTKLKDRVRGFFRRGKTWIRDKLKLKKSKP